MKYVQQNVLRNVLPNEYISSVTVDKAYLKLLLIPLLMHSTVLKGQANAGMECSKTGQISLITHTIPLSYNDLSDQ